MDRKTLLRITRIFTYLMNWDYNPCRYERYVETGNPHLTSPFQREGPELRDTQTVLPFGKGEVEGDEGFDISY